MLAFFRLPTCGDDNDDCVRILLKTYLDRKIINNTNNDNDGGNSKASTTPAKEFFAKFFCVRRDKVQGGLSLALIYI